MSGSIQVRPINPWFNIRNSLKYKVRMDYLCCHKGGRCPLIIPEQFVLNILNYLRQNIKLEK